MVPLRHRRSAAVTLLVAFLFTLGAPSAHARWGHELDLTVLTSDGWVGGGLATRSVDPSDLLITRALGDDGKVAFALRMRKHYQIPGSATIRGCAAGSGVDVKYLVDGINVTDEVTDGFTTSELSIGSTEIRVVVMGRLSPSDPTMSCPMRVASGVRVHDSLTLRVTR